MNEYMEDEYSLDRGRQGLIAVWAASAILVVMGWVWAMHHVAPLTGPVIIGARPAMSLLVGSRLFFHFLGFSSVTLLFIQGVILWEFLKKDIVLARSCAIGSAILSLLIFSYFFFIISLQ